MKSGARVILLFLTLVTSRLSTARGKRALFFASAIQIQKLNNIAAGADPLFRIIRARNEISQVGRARHSRSCTNLTYTYARLKLAKLLLPCDVSFNWDLMTIINLTAARARIRLEKRCSLLISQNIRYINKKSVCYLRKLWHPTIL